MRYWVGVVAADHATKAVAEGICAFSHGKKPPVAKLSVGDRFVYYSPKTGISEGETVQAFTAIGTVTGDAPYEKKWAQTAFTAWVRDAKYQRFDPVPIKPLLVHLSFIPNPRYWGMAFRRGQFEIAAQDFALIEQTAGTQ
jgi:hypothetical protein